MGGLFAERFKPISSDILVSQDRFLALLLRNGAITAEQLRTAIDSYRRHPQDYAWMLRLRHATLDKADHVFFVRYGRFPTEDNDFPINSNYYQICRALQYDPDCFDEELKKLIWDVEGNPRVVEAPPKVLEAVERVTSKKGNAPGFILILVLGLASAIALPMLIANAPTPDLVPAVVAVGFCWMMLLICGLIATRPRQVKTSIVRHSCSACRSHLDGIRWVNHCPTCGVRFEEQSE
jgi:hypothetical protein